MLKFEKNVDDRKELVKRLGELTGIQPMYMRTPTYAFQCGPYIVDREGYLLVDDDEADRDLLAALLGEGMIIGSEADAEDATSVEVEEPSEEQAPAETDDGEAIAEDETEEPISDAEYQQEIAEEASAQTDTIDMNMAFPIPIVRHTGTSLRNLINLIYSRGTLINKATGGHFSVDEELVETLKDDSCTCSRENFLKMVGDYETQHGKSIYGLTITPEELQFTGFGEAPDMEHLTAYRHLAVFMNEQAMNQKRIQAKTVNDANEKYAMRIWLVRIGMDGDAFKKTRKILMEKLGGHTAFRTLADAEKARMKSQKKRDALRAAREAARTVDSDLETQEALEGGNQDGNL